MITSQKRHPKTWIHEKYPAYNFEDGFSEEDELWQPFVFEPLPLLDVRTYEVLADVWASDKNTWVSLTSHEIAIASIVRNIGHRAWKTRTADLLPVLVKARLIA